MLLLNRSGRADSALVIGINTYPNLPRGSSLDGCVNDANAMKKALEHHGFGGKITLLTNAKATHDGILKTLSDIAKRSGPNDRFVFYFAGHGSQTGDGHAVLLPYDVADDSLTNTLSGSELTSAILRIPGRSHTLLLDSCFAEGVLARGLNGTVKSRYYQIVPLIDGVGPGRRSRAIEPVNNTDNNSHVATSQDLCSFVSAKRTQIAGEKEIGGEYHGVFSYALAQQLLAGSPDDSWDIVQSRVCGSVAKLMQEQQTPVFGADEYHDVKIFEGRGGPKPARKPQSQISLWELFSETKSNPAYLQVEVAPNRSLFKLRENFEIKIKIGDKVGSDGGYLIVLNRDSKGIYMIGPNIDGGEDFSATAVQAGKTVTISVHGEDVGLERVKAVLFRSRKDAQELFDKFPKTKEGKNHKRGVSLDELEQLHARRLGPEEGSDNSAGKPDWTYFTTSLELNVANAPQQ
jgi:hypothetical protein